VPGIDHARLTTRLLLQDGVVSRQQILGCGGTDNDIERMLRRRDLGTVHRGVYVDHTGRLSPSQRAWAAVLAVWPAALAGSSALPARRGSPAAAMLTVAVDEGRRVAAPSGVRLRRMSGLEDKVQWAAGPPRVLIEHAALDVAAEQLRRHDVAGAYATLAAACGSRETNAARLIATLDATLRITGRARLAAMLRDLAEGANSVLERGYLVGVERGHDLPRGTRQRRSDATGRRTFQDVRYERQGVIVELDGRTDHDNAAARDADAARDLAELVVSDDITVRLTYGQVFRDRCRTAAMIASLLRRRGWQGDLVRCPHCPGYPKSSA
jgi:hypothetical protein